MLHQPTGHPQRHSPGHSLGVAIGLMLSLVLALICFWPALSGPFLFDDFPHLQKLGNLGGELTSSSISRYLASIDGWPNRPLAALSFLIEDSAWPAYPLDFKRDNLLLHLLAGVFVFLLARRLTSLGGMERKRGDWLALACTAMWLLHPVQLSSTMLVVQRMNMLATIFVLAGLSGYLQIVCSKRGAPLGRVMLAGTALTLAGFIAFLCKENGLLIFAYAAALNATLLRDHISTYTIPARRLLVLGTVAPIIMLLLVALANPDYVLSGYERRDFTLSERLLTQPRVLIEYVYAILVPRIGGQGIFHDGYVASRSLLEPLSTLPALLLLLGAAASAWALRRRYAVFAFCVLWFLAGHLMESSFIPLELYFEHRNYLPMLGPLFGLAWLVFHTQRARKLALSLLLTWIATCAVLTHFNARVWGDEGKLALVWLEENPHSSRAVQLAVKFFHDRGNYPAARRTLDEALARMPHDSDLNAQSVLLDCIHVGVTTGQWAAFDAYARDVEEIGVLPEVVTAFRKQALGPACRGTLTVEQFSALVETLLDNPAVQAEPSTMGYFHYELAKVAEHQRNLDRAMHHLEQAFRYRPTPFIPQEQAYLLLTAGLPREALTYLDRSEAAARGTKGQLLDMPRRNAVLRRSAEHMIHQMDDSTEAR